MKITPKKFQSIKELQKTGIKGSSTANLLNISQPTISYCFRSETYQDYKNIISVVGKKQAIPHKNDSTFKEKLYKKILSTSATLVLSHIISTNEDLEITTDDGKDYVISAKRVMRSRE